MFRRKGISNGVQTEWNLREHYFWNKRDPGDLEWTSRNNRGGHEAGGTPTPKTRHHPHGPLVTPPTYLYLLYISIYPKNLWEHNRSGVPLPQAFVATKNLSGTRSGTLPEGGIPHRWPSSSSRRSPWRGGSSSPSGLRVCTSSYVFALSFSCSSFGTILMYRELCYYSWILWCFSPSTLL